MPDVDHTDDAEESFDLDVRVPGLAYDVAQPGYPRVFVQQQLAESVTEYDGRREDGERGQLDYVKNALAGATEDDAVYQVVYLPEHPVSKGELNDPDTRYPVPESRLVPIRTERATPIDDSTAWTARDAVVFDTLVNVCAAADEYDGTDLDAVSTAIQREFGDDLTVPAIDAARLDADGEEDDEGTQDDGGLEDFEPDGDL